MPLPEPNILQHNFAPLRKEVTAIAAIARNVTETSEVSGFVGSGGTSIVVRLESDPSLIVRVPNQTHDTDHTNEELIVASEERLEALQRGVGQLALEQIHGYGPNAYLEGFHDIVTTYEEGQDFTEVVESAAAGVGQRDMNDFVDTLIAMDRQGLIPDSGLENLIFNSQRRKNRLVIVDYQLKSEGEGLRDSTWRFNRDILTEVQGVEDEKAAAAIVKLSNRFREAVRRKLGEEYAQYCLTLDQHRASYRPPWLTEA